MEKRDIMEAAGTDYEISQWREQSKRLDQIEVEFGYVRAEVHGLKGDIAGISDKLDYLRTQKPNLGVVFAGITLATLLMGAILAPLYKVTTDNAEAMRYIQQTRWTRSDHDRAMDNVTQKIKEMREEMQLELRDMRDWQRRQDDRLLELERNKQDK